MKGPTWTLSLFYTKFTISFMKGVNVMFDKIRYAYHLTCCERMIKNYSYIERDYELNKKFKWHKRKLNELMVKVHKRSRS